MAVSARHSHRGACTPSHDRCNDGEWNAARQHACTSCVPKIVEATCNTCYFLRRFPSFFPASDRLCRVRTVYTRLRGAFVFIFALGEAILLVWEDVMFWFAVREKTSPEFQHCKRTVFFVRRESIALKGL